MSQSPAQVVDLPSGDNYFHAWDALGDMIRRGRSLSGHERNCCFLNIHRGDFADVSAAASLDSIDDGRAISLVDWDHDGDVDLWIANRNGPRVRFLRNDTGSGHHFLSLRLQGTKCNRDAVGARVEVRLAGPEPMRLVKALRAGDGFLSQSSKWIHFGLGQATQVEQVRVRWPGRTSFEVFTGVRADARYQLVEGQGIASPAAPLPRMIAVSESAPTIPPSTDTARIVVARRPEVSGLQYSDFQGKLHGLDSLRGRPVLITLWASWCTTCQNELRQWARREHSIRANRLEVVALCCDGLTADRTRNLDDAKRFLHQESLPFQTAVASKEIARQLVHAQSRILYKIRPLPLPASFLIDPEGRLAVVYHGPISAEQLLKDIQLLELPAGAIPSASFAFAGRYGVIRFPLTPVGFAQALLEGGYLEEARNELQGMLQGGTANEAGQWHHDQATETNLRLEAYQLLASIDEQQARWGQATHAYRRALELSPGSAALQVALATVQWQSGNKREASELFRATIRNGDDPQAPLLVGRALLELGETKSAIETFRQALHQHPDRDPLRLQLAIAMDRSGQTAEAIGLYREVLARDPKSLAAANNLAWILATSSDARLRDPGSSLELAQRINQATEYQLPDLLDTLAASQAANQQFADAIETSQKAIEMALATGEHQQCRRLAKRLAMYRAGEPYRQNPATAEALPE